MKSWTEKHRRYWGDAFSFGLLSWRGKAQRIKLRYQGLTISRRVSLGVRAQILKVVIIIIVVGGREAQDRKPMEKKRGSG